MDSLKAYWSVEKKAFSLGNILIFRKELELIAKIQNKKKVVIHFGGEKINYSFLQTYLWVWLPLLRVPSAGLGSIPPCR